MSDLIQQAAATLTKADVEHAVGQAVYDRISALMDAAPETPEASELLALCSLVEGVEAVFDSWRATLQ